jgi:hypothetical protein
VEALVKETDSQEVLDGEDEEYLSEEGGNEPEESMPPPWSDVHTFIGKQGKTYIHRPGPERNGEILRDLFHGIKSTDRIRGYTFLIGFALAWGRQRKEIELVVKQWSETTLKNYGYAWNAFFDFLEEHDDKIRLI